MIPIPPTGTKSFLNCLLITNIQDKNGLYKAGELPFKSPVPV
jgi:hypothetical protein